MNALFDIPAHNPSFFAVKNAMKRDGRIVDFCVPVNPYFPPPELEAALREELPQILKHYPDQGAPHEEALARLTGLPADCIAPANGSTEIITHLCRLAEVPFLTTIPTFGRWTDLPRDFRKASVFLQRRAQDGFRLDAGDIIDRVRTTGARTLVLCNPDNPTGAHFESEEIKYLLDELSDLSMIVIDESFIDFSGIESAARHVESRPNLVVVKSLGKSVGWHGIRLGYAVACQERIRALRRDLPYWSVNGIASFVLKMLPDLSEAYRESFVSVARDRQAMSRRLRHLPGLSVHPSRANFLYATLPEGVSGRAVRDRLLARNGLLIRECSNKLGASERYLRLAVLPPGPVDRLADALFAVLTES